ncbi:MAG: hypothetical protein HC853_18905 [Anaerolineae bacterium]|nr:hypothetical protein [Anaerolineae bacterium]
MSMTLVPNLISAPLRFIVGVSDAFSAEVEASENIDSPQGALKIPDEGCVFDSNGYDAGLVGLGKGTIITSTYTSAYTNVSVNMSILPVLCD